MKKKVVREAKESFLEYRKALATLLISALGFVGALVWRDTIKAFFEQILNLRWGVDFYSTLTAALIVTGFAALLTVIVTKYIAVKSKK